MTSLSPYASTTTIKSQGAHNLKPFRTYENFDHDNCHSSVINRSNGNVSNGHGPSQKFSRKRSTPLSQIPLGLARTINTDNGITLKTYQIDALHLLKSRLNKKLRGYFREIEQFTRKKKLRGEWNRDCQNEPGAVLQKHSSKFFSRVLASDPDVTRHNTSHPRDNQTIRFTKLLEDNPEDAQRGLQPQRSDCLFELSQTMN